jgi:hypothetical protein
MAMSVVEFNPNSTVTTRGHKVLRAWVIGLCIVLGVCAVAVIGAALVFEQYYADRIYPGVLIEGFDVGGQTPAQAATIIRQNYERSLVTFDAAGAKWFAPWRDVGITVNAAEAASQAYAIGRSGRLDERLRSWQNRQPARITFGYDASIARKYLTQQAAKVTLTPTDASIRITNGAAVMLPGTPGRELDVEATLQGLYATALKEQPVNVSLKPLKPVLSDTSATVRQLNDWLSRPLTLQLWWNNAFITRTISPAERTTWVQVERKADTYAAHLLPQAIRATLTQVNAELGQDAAMRLDEATGMVQAALQQGRSLVWFVVPRRELLHVVKPGDTFENVGDAYGIPVSRILDANPNIWQEGGFAIGQAITIPAQSVMLPVSISPTNQQRIEVNLTTQHLSAYDGPTLVLSTSISSGIPKWRTLVGVFQVQEKVDDAYNKLAHIRMPNWLSIYDIGDPGNSLTNGIHALPILGGGGRLWAGYLGHPVSFGCVVMGIEDSDKLYHWVQVGTPVLISGTTPSTTLTYDNLIEAENKTAETPAPSGN